MNSLYLDSIRSFEGFTPQAQWDYAQHSNGYGTRALYPGEVIDRAEAERRFRSEIENARTIVERYAGDADDGTKAALTSLTFNAGTRWTKDGLGEAVRRGDLETARALFLEYNKAGGKLLEGLATRRMAEAQWIGNPFDASGQTRAEPWEAPSVAMAAAPVGDGGERPATVDRRNAVAALERATVAAVTAEEPGATTAAVMDAGPLLMSLRLHMALAASSRFDQSDDTGKDTAGSADTRPFTRT